MKDKNNVSYAPKAMIKTGLSLDVDGTVSESQLFGHLRGIFSKYRVHFNRQLVNVDDEETETESENENDGENLR